MDSHAKRNRHVNNSSLSKSSLSACIATTLIVLTATANAMEPASIQDGITGNRTEGWGISGDGNVVIGLNNNDHLDRWLFRWSLGQNMTNIISFEKSNIGAIFSINYDGSVLTGSFFQNGAYNAFRWDAVNGATDLGTLGGSRGSISRGISDDGKVIVGESGSLVASFRAFRWTVDLGMQDLGSLIPGDVSSAFGVSGDGQAVVGLSGYGTSARAVRWKDGLILDLGSLAGEENAGSYGIAANVDGSVVVGAIGSNSFRWTEVAGMTSLGSLGGAVSIPRDVSADGSVVVGMGNQADGSQRGYRWTEATGMTPLDTLRGDVVSTTHGISADGRIIVGTSSGGQGTRAVIWAQPVGSQEVAGPQDTANIYQSVQNSANTSARLMQGQAKRTRDVAESRCIPGVAQAYCLNAGASVENADGSHQGAGQIDAGLRANEHLSVGGSVSQAKAEFNDVTAEQRKEFGLGVWLAHQQDAATGSGWNATASLSLSHGDSRFQRGEDLTDMQRASVQVGIRSMAKRLAVGYGVNIGASLLTPQIALSHVTGKRQGFEETGVVLPLRVDSARSEQAYATLGVHSLTPLSVRSSLHLGLAVDAVLNDEKQVLEGASDIPGLNRFAVQSRLQQRGVIPTGTAGYSFAFTEKASITTQARIGAGAFEQQRPVIGLSAHYRYAF